MVFLRLKPRQRVCQCLAECLAQELNMAEKEGSLFRAIHHMRHGGLHRALHVSEDEAIPASKLSAAEHSDNPHIRKMVSFAHTLKGLHKK
jgi:hypothetical protein